MCWSCSVNDALLPFQDKPVKCWNCKYKVKAWSLPQDACSPPPLISVWVTVAQHRRQDYLSEVEASHENKLWNKKEFQGGKGFSFYFLPLDVLRELQGGEWEAGKRPCMLIPCSDAARGGINILPTWGFQDTVSAIKPSLFPRKSRVV